MTTDEQERLRALAAWLPAIEDPCFDFGSWAGAERRPDGSISAPYFDFSRAALDFLAAMPVRVFDWRTWSETDECRALLDDHARVAHASADQLVKLATFLVRADRFSEGTLAHAWETGLLRAMTRRAAVRSQP